MSIEASKIYTYTYIERFTVVSPYSKVQSLSRHHWLTNKNSSAKNGLPVSEWLSSDISQILKHYKLY